LGKELGAAANFPSHFIHDLAGNPRNKSEGNVIAETAGGGATGATGTVREYIWLPEGEITPTFRARAQVDRPLAVVNAVNTTPVTWYVHVDHLSRPIKMTTSTKASVWDAVWQPWGNAHTITGTAVLDARFPGQWFQLETGLHYNWNRTYDPSIGRYTQPDPLGFVDGPSVYGYARGGPQSYVDKDGRTIYTYSFGGTVAAGPWGVTASSGGGIDTVKCVIFRYSSYGWQAGFNMGAAPAMGVFNGDLESFAGRSLDFQFGVGPVSGAITTTRDDGGKRKWGGSLGGGIGLKAGLSGGLSNTIIHEIIPITGQGRCGCEK
jgi:RHS repeat-associated protein